MAVETDERGLRLFTQDEVVQMAELGVLEDIEQYELLNGFLVRKVSGGEQHELAKERVLRWLAPGLIADRYRVRVECALRTANRLSLPEPDVMVLPFDRPAGLPAAALLVIEVADTSLRYDRTVKPPLYAGTQVPEYWSIDVNGRSIRVHTDPEGDAYRTQATVDGGTLTPIAADTGPLDVDALLADLADAARDVADEPRP